MRALRTTLAAAWFLSLAPLMATAADVTAKQLMGFRPSLKGVEYELPTDPAAIAACKAETIPADFSSGMDRGRSSVGSSIATATPSSTSGATTRTASRSIESSTITATRASTRSDG